MKTYITLGLIIFGLQANGQAPQLVGGGEYKIETAACVSPAQYQSIHHLLEHNIDSLSQIGLLKQKIAGNNQSTQEVSLAWPLAAHNGLDYPSFYAVSNYVDHNSSYPNQVLDWNCGTRTYDLNNGYNHQGTDIFTWPFGQYLQEEDKVAIVAATSGTIIAKHDGNYDKNCQMGNADWNAVYIKGDDGYTYWYGHMKKNSLTNKAVGDDVQQGEYLGIVGSSGSSTGPHLHFEVYDEDNQLVDPFEGPCNNVTSLWENQESYYEPTINAVMTHVHAPSFPDCPNIELINKETHFYTGDVLFFAVYLRDQKNDTPTNFKIINPNGAVHSTWSKEIEILHYPASYWYWSYNVTSDFMTGEWKFEAELNGTTVSTTFYINVDKDIAIDEYKYESLSLNIYPNPGKENFKISGLEKGIQQLIIYDLKGRKIFNQNYNNEEIVTINLNLPAGYYIVEAQNKDGLLQRGKMIVQ